MDERLGKAAQRRQRALQREWKFTKRAEYGGIVGAEVQKRVSERRLRRGALSCAGRAQGWL